METFSALLAICAGNSLVTGEFPAQRPVTRSFDVFFDVSPNKRLSKQWRHCNGSITYWVTQGNQTPVVIYTNYTKLPSPPIIKVQVASILFLREL